MMLIVYISFTLVVCLVGTLLLPSRRKNLWGQRCHEMSSTDETSTIIFGAGVVGLCTAYNLAKSTAHNTSLHRRRIIVVENAGKVFSASSSADTGILSYHELEEGLRSLGRYSFEQWKRLGRDDSEFGRHCGYREEANIASGPGLGVGHELFPEWIRTESEWDATLGPKYVETAIINPVALGQWLYKQCVLLGVEFRMNTQAVYAHLSRTSEIVSLNVIINNEEPLTLACNKLVVAAGPWTPALFAKLFPNSLVKFKPIVSASHWLLFANPAPLSNRSIGAASIDEIIGHKLAFAARNDHTIFATGEQSSISQVPNVGDVSIPDPNRLTKLKTDADIFLKRPYSSKQGLRVIGQGRAYSPATRTGLPVIAGIPAYKLSAEGCNAGNTSVYVNSGHGSYGITLGMGSGKVMSQIVLGEETDVDVSHLGLLYG